MPPVAAVARPRTLHGVGREQAVAPFRQHAECRSEINKILRLVEDNHDALLESWNDFFGG